MLQVTFFCVTIDVSYRQQLQKIFWKTEEIQLILPLIRSMVTIMVLGSILGNFRNISSNIFETEKKKKIVRKKKKKKGKSEDENFFRVCYVTYRGGSS